MITGFTKSIPETGTRGNSVNVSSEESALYSFVESHWFWFAGGVMVLAAFVRLFALSINPFHHDEGVNGFFLTRLFNDGTYIYDPANYHGPTLYYFALAVAKVSEFLFGHDAALTPFSARFVTSVFGIATVWLVLYLRRYIGNPGALFGAILLALSPGAVYMSRYFIHETLFVFFTLGILVAALRFYETRDLFYLIAGSISCALLFATKETAFISVGVFVIALVCIWIYDLLRKAKVKKGERGKESFSWAQGPRQLVEALGGYRWIAIYSAIAIAVFVLVAVVFYSSFFTNWKGVRDAVSAVTYWTRTGKNDHAKPPYKYLQWLFQEESILLVGGAVGALLAVIKGNRVALFVALWAFGILAAYSILPYKTPWLAVNFIVPLSIITGYGISELFEMARPDRERSTVIMVGVLALAIVTVQMVRLNFYRYDDEAYPYVYVHTNREMFSMLAAIDRLAKSSGTGEQTTIAIMAPEYWPLPWYLSKYKHVGYYGKVSNASDAIVIVEPKQEAEVGPILSTRYRQVGTYRLRPGVTLDVYLRKDIPG